MSSTAWGTEQHSACTVFLTRLLKLRGVAGFWLKALTGQTFLRNFFQRTSSLKTRYINVAANRTREIPAYQHFKMLPMQFIHASPTSFEFQASLDLMEHQSRLCGVNTFLRSPLELLSPLLSPCCHASKLFDSDFQTHIPQELLLKWGSAQSQVVLSKLSMGISYSAPHSLKSFFMK